MTRNMKLDVCQAVIDTKKAVCVNPDGRETDVTVTALIFDNLLIEINLTLQLLNILTNSNLK